VDEPVATPHLVHLHCHLLREQEAFKNTISSQLRFAALHDCETKWKQCGKPANIKKLKGQIDK